jgi:hypothetical protein
VAGQHDAHAACVAQDRRAELPAAQGLEGRPRHIVDATDGLTECLRTRETEVLIDLTQQQQAAIAAEVPTAEIGLNQAPAKAPKLDLGLGFGTVWHRQSSVGMGGEYL